VAPTLSDRWTLRLEPSLLLTADEIDRVHFALADVCQRLQRHDALGLTSFMASSPPPPTPPLIRSDGRFFAYNQARFRQQEAGAGAKRVAWLCHFIDEDDFTSLEPSFKSLSR